MKYHCKDCQKLLKGMRPPKDVRMLANNWCEKCKGEGAILAPIDTHDYGIPVWDECACQDWGD